MAISAEKNKVVSDSSAGTNPKEAKKDRMKWAVRLLSWVPTLACLSLCALLAFRLVNLESRVEVIQWQLQKLQTFKHYHTQENSHNIQKRSVKHQQNDEEDCSCTGLPGNLIGTVLTENISEPSLARFCWVFSVLI